jgi:hypothetical protein
MRLEDPSSLDFRESRFSGRSTIEDAASRTVAFRGAEGVFVLVPPNFDPEPGFPEARAIGAALRSALEAARPKRVVYLSTIGAQASQPNLLTQHTTIEQALNDLPMPIIFLRPAWFMENYRWDVNPGARAWSDSEFPSTAGQAGADGGYSGYWETGRCLAARTVERPPRGGIGRTAPRDSKRDRRCIHEGPEPVSANANRAARFLGGTFQVAGDEEPTASDADAEWL